VQPDQRDHRTAVVAETSGQTSGEAGGEPFGKAEHVHVATLRAAYYPER
jgi:hypothetical protein